MASLLVATGEEPTCPPRPRQPSTEPPVGFGQLQPTGAVTSEAPRAQFTRRCGRTHTRRRVDWSSAAGASVRAVCHGVQYRRADGRGYFSNPSVKIGEDEI